MYCMKFTQGRCSSSPATLARCPPIHCRIFRARSLCMVPSLLCSAHHSATVPPRPRLGSRHGRRHQRLGGGARTGVKSPSSMAARAGLGGPLDGIRSSPTGHGEEEAQHDPPEMGRGGTRRACQRFGRRWAARPLRRGMGVAASGGGRGWTTQMPVEDDAARRKEGIAIDGGTTLTDGRRCGGSR